MNVLLDLYLIAGMLLVALSLPLIFKIVRPNPIYGFRVAKSIDNPEIWYAVNSYSGKRILVAGVSILIAAVLFYWIPGISVDAYALGCLGVFMLVFGIGIIQSLSYLKNID